MQIAVDHRTPSPAPRAPRAGSLARPSRPASDEALRDVLAELGERVKPVALARERTMPIGEPFDQLIPDGLVRGQVVSCRGSAARSMAFGLVGTALAEGAWMAVVDVATFGTDAAAEFGVPLERVVRIDTDPTNELDWVDVMAAAVDGFDIVLTSVPTEWSDHRHRPAAVRKLRTRLQHKGAVVITLDGAGVLGDDIEVATQRASWEGLEEGAGHLRRRVVQLRASGRRMPNARSCSIEMVGDGTRVRFESATDSDSHDGDPQAELLAEMVDAVPVVDLADRSLAG